MLEAIKQLAEAIVALPFTILKSLVGALVTIVMVILATLNTFFIHVINLVLRGQNFILENDVIVQAWLMMRSVANILFFLALTVFAIMIITRTGGYNFKKAITGLITTVVLANLSYQIVLVFIEMGDALKNSVGLFTNKLSDASGQYLDLADSLGALFNTKALNLGAFVGQGIDLQTLMNYFGVAFMILIVSAITTYAFFRLAFILIERAVRLILLVIFAPIQFALSLFPHKDLQGMAQQWWSDLIRWVLVMPLAFLLMGIAYMLKPSTDSNIYEQVMFASRGQGGADAGILMYYIVVIALMLAAANAHNMLKLPVSAAVKTVTGWADIPFTAASNFAKTEVAARLKQGAFLAAQKFAPKETERVVGAMTRRQQMRGIEAEQRKLAAETAAKKAGVPEYIKLKTKTEAKVKLTMQQQNIPEDRKYEAERLARQQDPALFNAFDREKKGFYGNVVKERELASQVFASPEAAFSQADKLIKQIRAGDTSAETYSDFRGIMTHIANEAGKTGPGAIPWKLGSTKYFTDPAASELFDQAAVPWMPKEPFKVLQRDRERWEEGAGISPTQLSDYAKLTQANRQMGDINAEIESLTAAINNLSKTMTDRQQQAINQLPTTVIERLTSDDAAEIAKALSALDRGSVVLEIDNAKSNHQEILADVAKIQQGGASIDDKRKDIGAKLRTTGMNSSNVDNLSTILAHGIGIDDVSNAKTIAPVDNLREYLAARTALQTKNAERETAQQKISVLQASYGGDVSKTVNSKFVSQPQYELAVQNSLTKTGAPEGTPSEYLNTGVRKLRDEILSHIGTAANPQEAASQPLGQSLDRALNQHLYNMINHFDLQTIKPNVKTIEDFEKQFTATEIFNVVQNLIKASQPRPTQTPQADEGE